LNVPRLFEFDDGFDEKNERKYIKYEIQFKKSNSVTNDANLNNSISCNGDIPDKFCKDTDNIFLEIG
jgi:hypothetical protein